MEIQKWNKTLILKIYEKKGEICSLKKMKKKNIKITKSWIINYYKLIKL